MKAKCPICSKAVGRDPDREDDQFPFCSERCRMIDLGNWATEKYVISSPASIPDAEDPNEG
ncbi:MAG: DNA gyrase inhibitor YacG [Acidobacteriota bacterium]|nr:DNA gyrase inhibitor YacG [Acidobacteriota bacterium]